jgi:hypothetical protein
MAKRSKPDAGGSWLLAEELFERGEDPFVDELRGVHDAGRLGAFAPRWFADGRPEARRLLLEYLDRPLNAYRHEPLLKRLFKLAEQAADDTVMARFLVALDRSVRRVRSKRTRYDWTTREISTEETIRVPANTTLPRSDKQPVRDPDRKRLFSVRTRSYLRRRAWRYFRNLGKQQPARYVPGVVEALKRYTDDDVADGLALIDNWGLIHVLFHHCPALVAKAGGWRPADGHTLAELEPAPAFEPLWQAAADPLVELLEQARCRPVRQWAIQVLRRHHPGALSRVALPRLLALLGHQDPEVSAYAAEALRDAPALAELDADQWLALVRFANPQTLGVLCELIVARLNPDTVTLEQAAKLAASRPLPVARLGLTWLQSKRPTTAAECRALLALAEAEAKPIRTELVRWARDILGTAADFEPAWVLEFLDSRYADVREVGWAWFHEEPRAREDVHLWQRLLESPHDDIRLRLVAMLEAEVSRRAAMPVNPARLDAGLLRSLWATVLLNIHRGGRSKPLVVGQVVRRLERHPEEAAALLPLLAVALRSVRGPEWRAGLAGLVRLVERSPEVGPAVGAAMPELTIPAAP